MMGKVQSGEWPEQKLIEAMDSYLERDNYRALFGLPPIQPKPQQQPEHVQYSKEVQG
ncbi:mobC domain protein [Escherichia coli P0305260.2]|nr:mobC domain protein [Escherichia coli P0305260.2]